MKHHEYTCVKCNVKHEASTGSTYAALCRCGNQLMVVIDELHTIYVIAESPDAAEKSASYAARGKRNATKALERWEHMPLGMQTRYQLYSVRIAQALDKPKMHVV